MYSLGEMFYEMYRTDLLTLDLIVREAERIRAERQRYPQFSIARIREDRDLLGQTTGRDCETR